MPESKKCGVDVLVALGEGTLYVNNSLLHQGSSVTNLALAEICFRHGYFRIGQNPDTSPFGKVDLSRGTPCGTGVVYPVTWRLR